MNQLRHIQIQVTTPLATSLGEGVMWDADHALVRWVDILDHRMYSNHPESGDREFSVTPPYQSVIVPTAAAGYLLAAKGGIQKLAAQGHQFELACEIEASVLSNRCNDGKCDPQGRFWIGTMAMDETAGAGSVYRIDSEILKITNE